MSQSDEQGVDLIAEEAVNFHEDSRTFRTKFDHQTRRPSEAIIAALAEAKGVDITALPPLFPRIDTDALDTIFSPTLNGMGPRDGSITFEHMDCQITVNSHGTVVVDPADESTENEGR